MELIKILKKKCDFLNQRSFFHKRASTKVKRDSHTYITLIAETGYTIALALIINFIGSELLLAFFPTGGGISFWPVPLILYAWRWGLNPALAISFLYGLLTFILPGAVILSWYQVIFDYFLNYLPLALVIVVRPWITNPYSTRLKISLAFIIGPSLAFVFVFIIAFISGFLFYGSYASPGEGPYLYSFIYNFASTAGTLGFTVLVLLAAQSQFVKLVNLHYSK